MVVRKILFKVLIIIIPLSLGIFFSIYINQGHGSLEDVSATVLRDAKPLPKFVLEDHFGNGFTNKNLKNQWSFVFFGYTHCPDVCPTTLALLNQVDQVLKKEKGIILPKTIFISVDPERDTIEQLTDYVPYFNPEFIGVTGSMENLQVLTKSLGIAFGNEGDADNVDYEVFHSTRIMLIDPEVRLKALFSFPHDVNQIVSDYIKIIGS
ncbi:MAG: SCO family protein [Gammaproteobacteria bacterium]|nr:MAG: SCO family protein [Gammaproteobacteria bacterium]